MNNNISNTDNNDIDVINKNGYNEENTHLMHVGCKILQGEQLNDIFNEMSIQQENTNYEENDENNNNEFDVSNFFNLDEDDNLDDLADNSHQNKKRKIDADLQI